MKASVIIPTYNRAKSLSHVLTCLCKQSFRNFDVYVILKPSLDNSESVLEYFKNVLPLTVIHQSNGGFLDALNLGLENADGSFLVFLDDDVSFDSNLLSLYAEAYSTEKNLGGVAGSVLPQGKRRKPNALAKVFYRSVHGMENYACYVSKAGFVYCSMSGTKQRSLLFQGANLSILASAAKGFRFPTDQYWIRGLHNEQYLGWHLFKQGYKLIYDPAISVFHSEHLSLSRDSHSKNLCVEKSLLFYRLRDCGFPVSRIDRTAYLGYEFLRTLKQTTKGNLVDLKLIPYRLYGEVIGASGCCKVMAQE